jgi:hypothetical protein
MQAELFVPDRFDIIQREAPGALDNIIVPVDAALAHFDSVARDMRAARRGAFQIVRGESGSGKSTFLHTIHLFREDVETIGIPRTSSIQASLSALGVSAAALRIVVIEGREALRDTSAKEIEAALHDINAFLRSASGKGVLVVWPCNADDLQRLILERARTIGGDALLGVGPDVLPFSGPERGLFIDIAQKTVATLNNAASLADLGVSSERATALLGGAATIGGFLGLIRTESLANRDSVFGLLKKKEQCRMWVIVAASNDPDNDVAALTRGSVASVDIDRLMSATDANSVKELKKFPDKLGILGTVLDAKVLHLPVLTALSVARSFGDSSLHEEMKKRNLLTKKDTGALVRFRESEAALAFGGVVAGIRQRSKVGDNTRAAFKGLVDIATKKDSLLNGALARALVTAGAINSFKLEQDLGEGLTKRSDILTQGPTGTVRLEVMWRAKTGRAEIANYVLGKLLSYGKAIEFLA